VENGDVRGAPTRCLDQFEALGPIELEGVADPVAVVPSGILLMSEVALRETIDADLGTLFEFQAEPEASAMAAFPSRDLPEFLEHEAKIKADSSMITRTIVAGGGVVGSIGSWEVEGERDVGFWIGRDHWGNRYATAALRAFLDIDLPRSLCLSADAQMSNHLWGYEPGDTDAHDMRLLHDRLGRHLWAIPIGVNLAVPLWGVGTGSLRRTPRLRKRIGR
jgi:hypothetical protein